MYTLGIIRTIKAIILHILQVLKLGIMKTVCVQRKMRCVPGTYIYIIYIFINRIISVSTR